MALVADETLAIFYDRNTRDFAEIIMSVAKDLHILVADRLMTPAAQTRLSDSTLIAAEDQDAIDGARGVMIALSSAEGARPYKLRLLSRAMDESRCVGVLPDAVPSLLSCGVDIDYNKVEQRCNELALALLAGDRAEVITHHPRNGNAKSTLLLHIGKFERPPITSTGIIERGAWGNLPGGETFIAPLEGEAKGTFVLNGAFSGHIVDPENPLLLTFDAGFLVGIDGPADVRAALLRLLQWEPEKNASSRLQLAELGIGVNEGLFELTGNALFDEKVSGTLHIAVGENHMYGGTLRSFLHEDFIARKPTLRIDGKFILREGNYVLNPSDWRESYASLPSRGKHLSDAQEVGRSDLHGHEGADGNFRVRRHVGANRKCVYTLGDEVVSPLLWKLYRLIPDPPESVKISALRNRWNHSYGAADPATIRGMVALLETHHVVECFAPEDYAI
jgi:hypothetical protein